MKDNVQIKVKVKKGGNRAYAPYARVLSKALTYLANKPETKKVISERMTQKIKEVYGIKKWLSKKRGRPPKTAVEIPNTAQDVQIQAKPIVATVTTTQTEKSSVCECLGCGEEYKEIITTCPKCQSTKILNY